AGREALGIEGGKVQVHHHLPLSASIRVGHGCALDGGQPDPQEVYPKVKYLSFGEGLAAQAELEDWHAGSVVADDQGRRNAGRQGPQLRLGNGGDLRDCSLDLYVGMKKNLNDRDATERLRFDMLDVINRGSQGTFIDRHDALAHFLGRKAGVAPDNANDGNADIRENVGGRPKN